MKLATKILQALSLLLANLKANIFIQMVSMGPIEQHTFMKNKNKVIGGSSGKEIE